MDLSGTKQQKAITRQAGVPIAPLLFVISHPNGAIFGHVERETRQHRLKQGMGINRSDVSIPRISVDGHHSEHENAEAVQFGTFHLAIPVKPNIQKQIRSRIMEELRAKWGLKVSRKTKFTFRDYPGKQHLSNLPRDLTD